MQVLGVHDVDWDHLGALLVKTYLHIDNLLAQPRVLDGTAVEPGLTDIHFVYMPGDDSVLQGVEDGPDCPSKS